MISDACASFQGERVKKTERDSSEESSGEHRRTNAADHRKHLRSKHSEIKNEDHSNSTFKKKEREKKVKKAANHQ